MDDDELLPFNEAWVLFANMEGDATGDAEFSALAARSVDKGRGSITVLLHSYLLRSRWRPNALYSTRVLVSTVALRAARPLAVWWADMRRLHGAMWGAYAVTGRWELLAADTAIGAMAWKNQFF